MEFQVSNQTNDRHLGRTYLEKQGKLRTVRVRHIYQTNFAFDTSRKER